MQTVKLNNGVEMPQVGYGVYQVSPEECECCVSDALCVFFANPLLGQIGQKYGKSVAQVALRWLVQREVIIISKSTHIERMRQNMDIFDFELSDEDMAAIAGLDTGKSLFFDHHDAEVTRMFMGWK